MRERGLGPRRDVQLVPPLVETALVRPLAPPSFQRSCWTDVIRWFGVGRVDGDVRLHLRVGVIHAAKRRLLRHQLLRT